MLGMPIDLADNWLRHVQDVRNKHQDWLNTLEIEESRFAALCELNVLQQSRNACETSAVQDAWQRGQKVVVRGWAYGLRNGLLEDLNMTILSFEDVRVAYEKSLAAVKVRYAPIGMAPQSP